MRLRTGDAAPRNENMWKACYDEDPGSVVKTGPPLVLNLLAVRPESVNLTWQSTLADFVSGWASFHGGLVTITLAEFRKRDFDKLVATRGSGSLQKNVQHVVNHWVDLVQKALDGLSKHVEFEPLGTSDPNESHRWTVPIRAFPDLSLVITLGLFRMTFIALSLQCVSNDSLKDASKHTSV